MDTQTFLPGQRWISDPETELGLGTVIKNSDRQVTIVFLYSGETRIYSTETAPLTRVQFHPGETIESHEGWMLTVTDVEESEGLMLYHGVRDNGEITLLPETSLSNFIQLNQPQKRLLNGQLDDNKWFELRAKTYNVMQTLSHSTSHGLRGARIEIIPHQLYIAHEVGSRVAPRVLLADEVGLGKTIEAGLIMHYQLLREEINRVLVVVPDSLVHQWLVEMMRRFNLQFQILDEEKYAAIKEEDPEINPFSTSQLALCTLDFLQSDDSVQNDAVAAGWDTLVVDEAHHLNWSENETSLEYAMIEELASSTPSVLLLTATPEQLGQEGHFARLRLLDPDRFDNLNDFVSETDHYKEIAELATKLHDDHALSQSDIAELHNITGSDLLQENEWNALAEEVSETGAQARKKLLTRLIDQHGTGRLLFRNTRAAIKGFPERHLQQHALAEDKPRSDATLDWLNGFLKDIYPNKCLMICSTPDTVMELAERLRIKSGIHAATFHEEMSIVERDRAAAWFANPEDDCPILISSEIGSEGRNFQFLHHLILYEIPENPDLLEQRIGRLDRIGQLENIQIHVPYQEGSRDHLLMRWYHEGLNAFEKTCTVGAQVANELRDELETALACDNAAMVEELLEQSQTLALEKTSQLESGRDKLLELNSNQPEKIADLLTQLSEEDNDAALAEFMSTVFDCYGVDFEEQSNGCWIVRPGRHMSVSNFPGIPDEGMTLTFERAIALSREDVEFMTWDHPLVSASIDLTTSNPDGQAALSIIETSALPHGSVYLESLHRVQCTSNSRLNTDHYLPPETLRFVLNEKSTDLSGPLSSAKISELIHPADKKQMRQFIKARTQVIQAMIKQAEELARKQLPALIETAKHQITQEYDESILRMQHLQKVNSLIRDDEIQILEKRRTDLLDSMDAVVAQLVGLRVLVNIH